jgi:3-oxoacyl-[acyl-carrier-protein] synthase-3
VTLAADASPARREAPPARTGAALAGAGHAVPATVVSNAEIARRLGVDEAWIESRTGTRERHVLAAGERLTDLAAQAGEDALRAAGVAPGDVDMVLVGTTSADEMSPHAAPLVAGELGIRGAAAIDLSAACTGFLSGLALGAATIETGRARTALVVGADGLSRYLDPDDRGTAMLFGDGAGAAVLTAADPAAGTGPVALHSDPDGQDLIRLGRDELRIRMDGPVVFRHAVRLMVDVTHEAAAAAGVALDDIDLFVYHQANSRIIGAVARELGADPARVLDVVARFANTSAASIPIALSVAAAEGRLAPGDTVLLAAFGAGLVWGGTVATWRPGRVAHARSARG